MDYFFLWFYIIKKAVDIRIDKYIQYDVKIVDELTSVQNFAAVIMMYEYNNSQINLISNSCERMLH